MSASCSCWRLSLVSVASLPPPPPPPPLLLLTLRLLLLMMPLLLRLLVFALVGVARLLLLL